MGWWLRWGSGGRLAVLLGVCSLFGLTLLYAWSTATVTTPANGGNVVSSDDEIVVGAAARHGPPAAVAALVGRLGLADFDDDVPPGAELKVGGERAWVNDDSEGTQTGECVYASPAEIDTVPRLASFDFQPYWMKSREYWDNNFENRYKAKRLEWPKLPLKVIVVPHSHNDPGWLKTFENYYHYQTKNILNNMVEKLTSFKNMTFIWTEMSFLSQWWQTAHPTKRRLLLKLIDQGRLEITTGGWVMTDEATSHVYGMVNQLIQGHQWVKNKLGITPNTGWSIDPFGHGPTVPYLLKASGVTGGTVIQRIHYAWKQWLAKERSGDFTWRQGWDPEGQGDQLVHNLPFDIYSIKHSCGPHPQVCLNFDFRKISGEYTEYSLRAVAIDEGNVKQKAELLLEQYGRTGSLFPHNVVLMPLGDDFRFDHDIEWDQQYRNYKKIFDYINNNKEYNAQITFGTPSDYFREVKARTNQFKTLKGDFFVYSDIFAEGRPAYWSGYYTTRPYLKILDREVEAELRSAEILYTFALNRVKKYPNFNTTMKILERDFEKLQNARQSLGLFQHHDAITGTSKEFVMHDYALKLFEAMQSSQLVQGYALQTLLTKVTGPEPSPLMTRFILSDSDRESYEVLPSKVPLSVMSDRPRRIIVFNSLANHRQEVIRLKLKTPNVRILDADYNEVKSQINPWWNLTRFKNDVYDESATPNLKMISDLFELVFIAELPALSVTTFHVEIASGASRATVYCQDCTGTENFPTSGLPHGDVQLENDRFRLLIYGRTGFLQSIMDKVNGKVTQCGIQFGSYASAQFHSGAYLFMPDPNSRDCDKDLADEKTERKILIMTGPVSSSLTVVYGQLLTHTLEIFHTKGPLGQAMYIENVIDFGSPPKNRETEMYMRFKSDINNGEPPEVYTDQNGLGTQKRVKIERIGIEGNYYPITTHAYIQDTDKRLTLLVNHASGGSSWQPGWLEVMLDRRTLYDDSRGMGEGVVDNKRTLMKYWLLVEDLNKDESYSTPSLLANHISLSLMYPANTFVLESTVDEATAKTTEHSLRSKLNFLTRDFPCNVHLMTLRTLQEPKFDHFPSRSALLILQKQGFSCAITSTRLPKCSVTATNRALHPATQFKSFPAEVTWTSLTGIKSYSKLTRLDKASLYPMTLATFNLTFT